MDYLWPAIIAAAAAILGSLLGTLVGPLVLARATRDREQAAHERDIAERLYNDRGAAIRRFGVALTTMNVAFLRQGGRQLTKDEQPDFLAVVAELTDARSDLELLLGNHDGGVADLLARAVQFTAATDDPKLDQLGLTSPEVAVQVLAEWRRGALAADKVHDEFMLRVATRIATARAVKDANGPDERDEPKEPDADPVQG